MDLGIAGKVALVTASSKGLGRASAVALAADGCRVVINGRDEAALAEASAAVDAAGGEVLAVVDDVTDPEAPARLVAATVEHFGGLDILVANAGGPPPGGSFSITDQQILDAVNANLLTSVRLAREARPHMAAKGWGRICCIASYSVKQPIPGLVLSNVARTGLWAWAKTAAQELAGEGITVNLALPGPHATDRMRQLGGSGPMGDPGDFGRVVAFLCSASAGFVTGTALQVDGGATLGLL